MARLESTALGGYYPTPQHLIPRIASLLAPLVPKEPDKYSYDRRVVSFVDPCAGEGTAVAELADLLSGGTRSIYACELESTRVEKARPALGYQNVLHGDAFRVSFAGDGVCVMFLNPPYDTDRVHGRLEERFLSRFTPALKDGGVLLFLVPEYALAASADTLARNYEDVHVFRFPEPDYAAFKQVVLFARKVPTRLESAPQAFTVEDTWPTEPLGPVPTTEHYDSGLSEWTIRAVDTKALLSKLRPWSQTMRGGGLQAVPNIIPELPVQDLLLRTYPVATPPRPAHIAAGIASGLFNGARLDSPGRASLLVKGVFDREYKTVEEKHAKDGTKKGEVQVQQPKLVVTVLDLDDHKYKTLDSAGVSELLANYGDSMMHVMERQCPVLYDPRRDAGSVTLPESPRKLFTAQAHATRAIVKLLERGQTAILLGEIGSGKCLQLGTKVLRFDGTLIAVEDVTVGDKLMGPDSKPRQVLGTTRGSGSLYKVTPVVGDPWVCNDTHILTLVHTVSGDVIEVSADEYAKNKRLKVKLTPNGPQLYEKKFWGRNTRPTVEFKQFFPEHGVEFSNKFHPSEHPIDPYFLGVWYGDGTKDLNSVSITKPDPEILAVVQDTAKKWGLLVRTQNNSSGCPTHHITSGYDHQNPLLRVMREIVGSGERLPWSYMTSDRKTRLEFLAGFLDTDGHLANGTYDFVQKRKGWAEDVCFIARSLGIRATMSEKIVPLPGSVPTRYQTYYRLSICGDLSQIPMRIARKRATPHVNVRAGKGHTGTRRTRRVSRTSISLESIGCGEYAGFELDGDGRFLLGDFTVTHNSSCAMITAETVHARRILVLCPPHLLRSWENEIAATLPDAKVLTIATVSDLDDLEESPYKTVVALLSRETAKLSHGWEGVAKHCPKCGGRVPKADLAKKRARCERVTLVTDDKLWPVARELALKLAPWLPEDSNVRGVLRGRFDRERIKILAAREKVPAFRWTGDLTSVIDELVTSLAKDKTERRMKALAFALILAADDELTLKTAMRLLPTGDDYDDGSAADVALLLPPNGSLQSMLVESRVSEDKSWGPWSSFAGRLKRALEGDAYSSKIGGCVLSWETGKLTFDGHARGLKTAQGLLTALLALMTITDSEPCGEFLYQAVPEPRRVALAKHIVKYHAKLFDFVILDEAHEYSSADSAQSFAAHRLTGLKVPTLLMTGTIMNGYAESLFSNMHAVSPSFRLEFGRDERQKFIDRYGYRKRVVEDRNEAGEIVEFGSNSDRVTRSERVIGNAPGLLPLFLLRHLLPVSVTLHKSDLAIDLPACKQESHKIDAGHVLLKNYKTLQRALIAQIKQDQFVPDRAGRLFGQLAELPSYLDRAASGDYEIRYPESLDRELVASMPSLPESTILPKEEWILSRVERELKEGRRVMVFSWHVSLLPRLSKLIAERIGEPAPILYADKVPTAKRQDWIDREIVRKERRVLVTNPVAIQTGLNNLVHFSTEIWHENPACNPLTFRQAGGRVDRIGQKLETRIVFPFYEDTLQVQLYDLLMKKVAVSVSTDGLDPEAALQAAGVGEDTYLAGLSIGKQLWKMMMEDAA